MKTTFVSILFFSALAFPVVAQPQGDFFSARWGMSPEQAAAALLKDGLSTQGKSVERDGKIAAVFTFGDFRDGKVVCYFYNNRLYEAVYYPAAGSRFQDVLEDVKTKYGEGKFRQNGNFTGSSYLDITEWSSDDTLIRYETSYTRLDDRDIPPQDRGWISEAATILWQSKKIERPKLTGPVIPELQFEKHLLSS